MEFTVEVPKGTNVEPRIRQALEKHQATTISLLDAKSGRVVVETARPWSDVLAQIESSGLRAALTGFGGKAAVSVVNHGSGSPGAIQGVIRFTSPDSETKQIVVDGVIDGLEPEKRFRVQINECGDLSKGCSSLGDMYGSRHVGSATSSADGRLSLRHSDDQFTISDLIGRSVVVVPEGEEKR